MTSVGRALAYLAIVLWLGATIAALVLAALAFSRTSDASASSVYQTRASSAAQAVAAATPTAVLFDKELHNAGSIQYATTGKFIVPENGLYDLEANIAMNVSGNTGGGAPAVLGPVSMWVSTSMADLPIGALPGLMQSLPASNTPSATNAQYNWTATSVFLAKGATIQLLVQSSVAQQILAGGYISIARIGRPSGSGCSSTSTLSTV